MDAHSDKDLAAGTYKGGFGFHPLLGWTAATGMTKCSAPSSGRATPAPTLPATTSMCSSSAWLTCPPYPAGKEVIVRDDSAMPTKELD